MQILEFVEVKGKGRVAIIDALPEGLNEGMYVIQKGNIFRVVGIGHYAMPRANCVGKPADLFLKPAGNAEAEVGELLMLKDMT